MIRVLHYGLSCRLGGIETYLYKLSKNINSNEIDFSFIWEGREKPYFYKEIGDMGFEFLNITSRRESFVKNIRDLERIFLKGNYDIFHCHLNTLSYTTPIKIAKKYQCKVIVHSRNGYVDQTRFYTMLLHKLNFHVAQKKDIFRIAVSDVASRWLFGSKKSIIVNNGIDVERFRFDEACRRRVRKQLGLEGKLVIGHVGSLSLQKNHYFLLQVFKEVLRKNRDSFLILIGDGSERRNIEERISELRLKDSVILLGNRNNIEQYLCGIDIFIFPSKFEGFPNAVLEAQTSGIPCIVSNTITKEVGVLESTIFVDLIDGYKTWAETALRLQNANPNRQLCADLIKEAGFSVESEVKKIEGIYRSLM